MEIAKKMAFTGRIMEMDCIVWIKEIFIRLRLDNERLRGGGFLCEGWVCMMLMFFVSVP